MTSSATGHLRLVTDGPERSDPAGTPDPAAGPSEDAAALAAVLAGHAAAAEQAVPSATAAGAPGRGPVLRAVATTSVLAVLLALLGSQAWELPGRTGGGMTAVPQPLLTFLLLCAAGCLWAAGRTAAPGPTLGSSGATAGWWSVAGGAAAVSVAADLSLASWAGTGLPGDLAVRAAVCVLPVLLAGALVPRTRAGRLRAALGTGVVTVPMTALGWALFASPAASPAGPADVLALTLLTGVAPFALAVALVVRTARR